MKNHQNIWPDPLRRNRSQMEDKRDTYAVLMKRWDHQRLRKRTHTIIIYCTRYRGARAHFQKSSFDDLLRGRARTHTHPLKRASASSTHIYKYIYTILIRDNRRVSLSRAGNTIRTTRARCIHKSALYSPTAPHLMLIACGIVLTPVEVRSAAHSLSLAARTPSSFFFSSILSSFRILPSRLPHVLYAYVESAKGF